MSTDIQLAKMLSDKIAQIREQQRVLQQQLEGYLLALKATDIEVEMAHRRGTIMGTVLDILEQSVDPWMILPDLLEGLAERGHQVSMTSLSPMLTKSSAVVRQSGKVALVKRVGDAH
jgi:hypothetical protein